MQPRVRLITKCLFHWACHLGLDIGEGIARWQVSMRERLTQHHKKMPFRHKEMEALRIQSYKQYIQMQNARMLRT